jgi:hypothetical protein
LPALLRVMAALMALDTDCAADFIRFGKLEELCQIVVKNPHAECEPRICVSAAETGRKVFQENMAALETIL